MMYSTFGTGRKVWSTRSNKNRIASYYLHVLSALDKSCWKGKLGTINKIITAYKIKRKRYYMWVEKILQNAREYLGQNKEYTGKNIKKEVVPKLDSSLKIQSIDCYNNIGRQTLHMTCSK